MWYCCFFFCCAGLMRKKLKLPATLLNSAWFPKHVTARSGTHHFIHGTRRSNRWGRADRSTRGAIKKHCWHHLLLSFVFSRSEQVILPARTPEYIPRSDRFSDRGNPLEATAKTASIHRTTRIVVHGIKEFPSFSILYLFSPFRKQY